MKGQQKTSLRYKILELSDIVVPDPDPKEILISDWTADILA